jgi:hypothetical protein
VLAPPILVSGPVLIEIQDVARFDTVLVVHVAQQLRRLHAFAAGNEALAALGVAQIDRAADQRFNHELPDRLLAAPSLLTA